MAGQNTQVVNGRPGRSSLARAAQVHEVMAIIEREKTMSEWFTIKDKNDISLSDDGETVQVRFKTNYMGNVYIEIPVELIVDLLKSESL